MDACDEASDEQECVAAGTMQYWRCEDNIEAMEQKVHGTTPSGRMLGETAAV